MANRRLAAAGALALATGFSAVAMPADAARAKAPFSSEIFVTRVGASPDLGLDDDGFPVVEEGSIIGIDGLIKVAGRTVGTIRQDCQLIDVASPCRGVLRITKGRRRGVVRYSGNNDVNDAGYFGFRVTSASGAFRGATFVIGHPPVALPAAAASYQYVAVADSQPDALTVRFG